jgi:hypothetical protein
MQPHGYPIWHSMYKTKQGINIYESFAIRDSRLANIFYAIFLKKHVIQASKYYTVLNSIVHLRKMLEDGMVRTPFSIETKFVNNRYQITKRHFHEE